MTGRDLYAEVTQRIVAELEKGVKPWEKPWRTSSHGLATMPQNLATGRIYSGINTLTLWLTALEKGYPSHAWATFKQVQEMGGKVRKGEKASPVIYVGMKEVEDNGKKVYRPFARWFMVFNHAQLEGVADAVTDAPQSTNKAVLRIMNQSGVTIRHGYDRACYIPSIDQVQMPLLAAFVDEAAYTRTLFHELVHSTGNDRRLNREFGKRFGDSAYAFEELVAELGSAFLCARIGTPYANENAEYIGAWVRKMKEDSKAIFTAASWAAAASEYLMPSVHDDAVSPYAAE